MNDVSTDLTTIRIVNKSKHPLPQYATEHSAGMDLRANLDASVILGRLIEAACG